MGLLYRPNQTSETQHPPDTRPSKRVTMPAGLLSALPQGEGQPNRTAIASSTWVWRCGSPTVRTSHWFWAAVLAVLVPLWNRCGSWALCPLPSRPLTLWTQAQVLLRYPKFINTSSYLELLGHTTCPVSALMLFMIYSQFNLKLVLEIWMGLIQWIL